MCSLIEQHFHSISKAECTVAADVARDRIVAMCSNGLVLFAPIPQGIKELICNFVQ